MRTVDLLQMLGQDGVEFVLVGGMAVQLHGYSRMTYDVDLVLSMNEANLARFIDVASRLCLAPVIPVPLAALKDASQLDQWHKEKGMLAFALREPGIGAVLSMYSYDQMFRLRSWRQTPCKRTCSGTRSKSPVSSTCLK